MALKSTRIKMTGTARERTSPRPHKNFQQWHGLGPEYHGTAINEGIDT